MKKEKETPKRGRPTVKVKPRSYQPTKAELEERAPGARIAPGGFGGEGWTF